MHSKAFSKFQKTARRCETLVDAYTTLHGLNAANNAVPAPPKDIVRGAVVLAVSALDAYVTDVFVEKLVTYLKKHKPDQDLIDLLFAAGLDTREALVLINMDRPYTRIRKLVSRYYAIYTTQKFDVIDKIFLPYRLKKLTDNAAAKTGKSSIKNRVSKLIERRHEIAHGGDYNLHGRINDIDEKRVGTWVKSLEELVKAMDEIICARIPTPVARQANVAVVAVPAPANGNHDVLDDANEAPIAGLDEEA